MNTHKSINRNGIVLISSLCLLTSFIWQLVPSPIIIIAICISPFAIIFTLRQPFLMIILFVIFSFFRIHEVFPLLYNFKIPLLLSLASLSALFWHVAISKMITIYWRPELTIISLFFILVIIGIIFSSNRPTAIAYFNQIYWKIILMTFAITWLSKSSKDFSITSILITFFGLLVGLVALYNKVSGIGLVEGTRVTIGRSLGSVLGDPNDLALVLMFPVAFAVSISLTPGIGRSLKTLGIFSLVVLFSAIIATQSRGGLLGIMAIFSIFGYRLIKNKVLFISICTVLTIVLFFLAGISDRVSGGASEDGIDASSMGRLYAWEAAIGMALHNPLTGVGLNNFYPNYFFYSPHWDGINHAVHSTWFGVLAETGFLGLLFFLAIIYRLFKTSLTCLNTIESNLSKATPHIHATSQAVFAGLVGTIISGTFLTQGFTWPIYILAALIIALARWVDIHIAASLEN